MGTHNQKRTPELVATAVAMMEAGVSPSTVADTIGISNGTLYQWVNNDYKDKARECNRRYKRNNRAKVNAAVTRWNNTPGGWASNTVRRCRYRADKLNLPFDLTKQDILDKIPKDGKCPVFGTLLEFGGGYSDNSPSIDRIVGERGYVRDNVAIISAKANTIKQNASADEIQQVADWVRKMSK